METLHCIVIANVDEKIKNKGKLILDATCAPADIKYPTDLGILVLPNLVCKIK